MRRYIWTLLVLSLLLCGFFAEIRSGSGESNTMFENGRAVSLRVLQHNLKSPALGKHPSKEITQLGGITHLWGYVIDPTNHDVILVGDSDPSAPPLHLDDLVVALRNAWWIYAKVKGNTQIYYYPECSIDPDPKVFRKLDEVGNRISPVSAIDEIKKSIQEWRDLCKEPQQVMIKGVPFDSRFGRVMVKADYDMKTIVDGSDDSLKIPGFKSLTDMTLDSVRHAVTQGRRVTVPLSTLNRFWFYPGENHYASDTVTAFIVQCPVNLRPEEQALEDKGGFRGMGYAHPMALAFCESFMDHYGEIAEQRPIYTELENLFRFVAVAKLMYRQNCTEIAGLELDYLLKKYPISRPRVKDTLPGRSNVKEFSYQKDIPDGHSELYLWLRSCGGVIIEIDPEKTKYYEDARTKEKLKSLRTQVLQARQSVDNLSWSFHLRSKSQLDRWEKFLKAYAVLQYDWVQTYADLIHSKTPSSRLRTAQVKLRH
jgi:hypothetical protein